MVPEVSGARETPPPSDAPLRELSFRSVPLRGRGIPRDCGSPASGAPAAPGNVTVPSADRAAAATSSSGVPSRPMMRRTAAGVSVAWLPRCRSISVRSAATSRIRVPEDSCCCWARSPTRLR